MRRLAVVAVLLLFAVACKKKVGDDCKPGEAVCPTKESALSCQNGKLVAVACRGPLGCGTFQEKVNCDDSEASEGDACMGASEEEYACSVDKKRAVVCRNGKFAPYMECRGKSGCALLGKQIACDTSVAAKEDPCKVQGASACSDDKKEMLVCRADKFAHYRYCRGKAGCYFLDGAPACDETRSLEGDECGIPGYIVCSVDGTQELVCQSGRFAFSRTCKTSCTVLGTGRGGIDCK